MKDDGEIVAYLARIVRNEYIRLSKRKYKILNNEAPLMENLIISEDAFEENIEFRVSLEKALDSLTPIQRQVIKKVILEDRKESEVAKEMNISRQAVNRTKKRALIQLRNHFVEKISHKEC